MSYLERILADSTDREAWSRARANRCGASDAAKFSKLTSAPGYAKAKLLNAFTGNSATAHGNAREAAILRPLGFEQNTLLFHAENNDRHVATPDGVRMTENGLLLAEVKTTNKPWKTIPLGYIRQVWWAQYVMGAERTIFGYEIHDNFIPTDLDPLSVVIERDDKAIKKLIQIADEVLDILDNYNAFQKELTNV